MFGVNKRHTQDRGGGGGGGGGSFRENVRAFVFPQVQINCP